MKRAAIIITDAANIAYRRVGYSREGDVAFISTSEQLLADLQMLAYPGPGMPQAISDASARVRALLPKEDANE